MDLGSAEIENCPSCGCAMDVSMLGPFTNVTCPECGEHTRVKCLLGNYELRRRQGVGGMSLVFGAEDLTLGREVAIKVLNEAYSMDEKRIAQFEQEAQITAGISHPHVVRVYTVGQAYGRFYIAMEMVAGDSLEKRMAELGALDEDEMVRTAVQVTEGLQAAHKAGLIHRDIKPGNILYDKDGHAKIVDFGLALVTQGGVAKADEIWATPYYVPPETLDGLDEDFRSDMYALGASLYHALSGEPPFDKETKSTTELKQIKMGLRSLKKSAPWVDAGLCAVIDKAMAFDPDDRFQSYGEMLQALRRLDVAAAVEGERPAVSPRAKRRRRTRREFPVMYVGGALLALVVGGAVIVAMSNDSDDGASGNGNAASPTPVRDRSAVSDAKQQLIAAEVRSARSLMRQGNYRAASNRLKALARDEEVPAETVYWAGLQSAIASLLDGRPADARKILREVAEGRSGLEGNDTGPEGKLKRAAEMLSRFRPLKPGDFGEPEDDLDMMILFAGALKNWEQGVWEDAEALFVKFAEAGLDGDSEEVELYEELVDDYLHDKKLLVQFAGEFEPATVAEAESRRSRVSEVAERLKTVGRAVFNVETMQRRLSMQIRAIEARLARAGRTDREKELSAFEMARASVRNLVSEGAFAEASEVLKNARPAGAEERAWREKMIYLTDSSVGFQAAMYLDLKGKSGEFEVKKRGGEVVYRRIKGATEDGVKVMSDGEEVLLAWEEIDPDSMLELHKRTVRGLTNEFEKNRRLEQAIAYAWLAGLKDKAGTAAAKLGVRNEDFAERWKSVMEAVR